MFLSKAKSNRSSSTPCLPHCVLQAGSNADTNEPRLLPKTAAATKIAHPSDARGGLHVSRPLHAQLSHPVLPFIFSVISFNPFSKESQDAIKATGNTELCELLDVEPKAQCRACLAYWDVGIVYCTCGHFLRDDTTENKKYIKSVLDLFSIPNFYIRKGRPHGHKYGKKGCKDYHTANQLQKKCEKRKYKNIHDRFIRDLWFRKTMLELGRTEEVIREMDRLANEDHTHIATEELDVYRGNW